VTARRSDRGSLTAAHAAIAESLRDRALRRTEQQPALEPTPVACRCCGAPPVAGAVFHDWCDDCQACNADGSAGEDVPRYDEHCPNRRR
jgi:hypothetical protein